MSKGTRRTPRPGPPGPPTGTIGDSALIEDLDGAWVQGIHLHKLPADLHTFRPKQRLRVSLADAHAALGTIGIPFTAMYALTGAYLSLLLVVYGGLVVGALQGDRQGIAELTSGIERPAFQPSPDTAPPLPFDTLLERYSSVIPNAPPFLMEIEGWGDAAAAAFSLLHFGRFGGPLLRGLFFVLALAASAVILTGNVLWIEVRRPRDARATPWLHRVLARLTSGVGVGLVAAVAVLFVATRIVPIDQHGRMAIEERTFFLAWAVFAAGALVWPSAAASARFLVALSGLSALAVPIVDGLGTGAWFWVSADRSHWAVFGVDAGFLVGGAIMCWIAWRGLPGVAPGRRGHDS